MTDGVEELLEADDAARLWARAAQLQAEAMSERGSSETDGVEESPPDGYALEVVRSAASEVGIGREFLDAALTELRAERALPESRLGKRGRALMRLFFRDVMDAVTVRRVVGARPEAVLEAIQGVVTPDPYRLSLRDRIGDPLDGGFLIFDVPALTAEGSGAFGREVISAGIRQVFASIRPLDDEARSCELTLVGPLTHRHRAGLAQGLTATGLGGFSGGVGVVLLVEAGTLAGPAGLLWGALAAAVLTGGTLGRKLFRGLVSRAIRRAIWAFEGLLGGVATRATGGWGGTTQIGGQHEGSTTDWEP